MLSTNEAARRLKQGEVVAIPTETVYGLAADASKLLAIQQIFTLKQRPSDNPLIIHIGCINQLDEFSKPMTEIELRIIRKFWPGPLTLVLPKKKNVLDAITAGLETVAVRMPNHSQCLNLLQKTGPLVAPSANLSGTPSPSKAEHVLSDFGENFPVLDGGDCAIGLESTVITCRPNYPTTNRQQSSYASRKFQSDILIYRPGAINAKELSEFGMVEYYIPSHSIKDTLRTSNGSPSPGLKYRHYAPKARVEWLSDVEQLENLRYPCVIFLLDKTPPYTQSLTDKVVNDGHSLLCCEGSWKRFGQLLYDTFRMADKENYTRIFIQDIRRHDATSSLKDAIINRIEKAISGH